MRDVKRAPHRLTLTHDRHARERARTPRPRTKLAGHDQLVHRLLLLRIRSTVQVLGTTLQRPWQRPLLPHTGVNPVTMGSA